MRYDNKEFVEEYEKVYPID
ncbi:8d110fc9-e604-4ae2-9c34-bc0bee07c13c [Thermothielavioides terrestris]|uniref:8d110fc9-e604-4ae2-9c34-bc0bee07c13c n=1 Tax=Thermothielavioides terrestris TaxID=2587410 RepID=A0A446B6H2_9PEZI|nr:8d110fc9-e604-4ae2-9c34-bc0bee07c13c [Thermothielavioides terrestris]